MTHLSLFVAAIAMATGVLTQGSKDTAGGAALQGTWTLVTLNGQPAPEGAPELTLTFSGDTYNQALAGVVNERGTIKVDASKKPMTIDLGIAEGDDAGKTQLGIIEVTGDTLRACFAAPGAAGRPTDFTVKEGVIVFVGKKAKS